MEKEFNIKDCEFGFLRAKFDCSYKFKNFDFDCFSYDGPFLVHYTNLKGLVGIVESGGFWLSDYRFLNDSEEYFNGCRMAKELILKISHKKRNEKFNSIFNKVLINLDKNPVKTYFICSFTKLCDSLEQWRGYANKDDAVAIIFKNNARLKTSHFSILPIFLPQKVIYEDALKKKMLHRIVSKFLIELRKDVASNFEIDEDSWAYHLASELSQEFMIFKNIAFSSEQEVRLVVSESHIHHFSGIKHRVVAGKIIPYICSADLYDINKRNEKFPSKLPIHEIKVGPTANQAITIESLKVFLSNLGYSNINVIPSVIPYRG